MATRPTLATGYATAAVFRLHPHLARLNGTNDTSSGTHIRHYVRQPGAPLRFGSGQAENARVTMQVCANLISGDESIAVDAMAKMFGSLPSTVAGWRGLDGGSGDKADVIAFPQTQ